jgi:hypothetical protein
MTLEQLLNSLSNDELQFIAAADYGEEQEAHLAALRNVVSAQGHLSEEQYWYPYEVIELRAHALEPGHEREFAACTLLVIQAVVDGYDSATPLGQKLADRAQDYDRLPSELRDMVLDAYQQAGC